MMKTAREKMQRQQSAKKKVLEQNFADMQKKASLCLLARQRSFLIM